MTKHVHKCEGSTHQKKHTIRTPRNDMAQFDCRVNDCEKSFESERGRRQHESRSHTQPIEPFEDEEVLCRLYVDQGLPTRIIGEMLGCDKATVINHLRKNQIPVRGRDGYTDDVPWKDAELMHELYTGKGWGSKKISDHIGVNRNTIIHWLKHHGIELRSWEESVRRVGANYEVASNGYPQWSVHNSIDGSTKIKIHTLLAISKGYDPHEVFDSTMHIHHKNGVKWDNREENIELLTQSEHISGHQKGAYNARF